MGSLVTPPWGDLVAEKDQPPIWYERFALSEVLMLTAQVWRTARMDVSLFVRYPSQMQAASQIWDELAKQIFMSMEYDTGGGFRFTVKLNTEEDPWRQTWRMVIQVEDGADLEGPINLLARFKERWQG